MAFYVGQKVVRFRDGNPEHAKMLPPKNVPFTVAWCGADLVGDPSIDLAEFPARQHHPLAIGFWAEMFRPVAERKTDISIFTEMLKPKERELARN